jgi:sugar O-acyltransferase (sialic acid O-acetyltransferase NeuD family)
MGGSPRKSLVIVGAGGFGREVLDIVEAIVAPNAYRFIGFVDDGEVHTELLARRGATCLGKTEALIGLGAVYVIGIGSGSARQRIDEMMTGAGCQPARLVHPAATLGSEVRLGEGVILAAGSRATTNISLGRHVQLHVNSTVGHDSQLSDYVSVYPGATISGNVMLGQGVTIGTGANVLPGLTVGAGAYVGAGAVVTRDVEPFTTVAGVPARPMPRD